MSEWQPIESAPKTGERIIAVDINDDFYEPCIVWWQDEWRDMGDIGANGQYDYEPTHWMPIPEPPIK